MESFSQLMAVHVQAATLKLEKLALLDAAFIFFAQTLKLIVGVIVSAVHQV
jgi:hypothetical protein